MGEIKGISIQGQENMLIQVGSNKGWDGIVPEATTVRGAGCIRYVNGELQIMREPEPEDDTWISMDTAPPVRTARCEVFLGSNWYDTPAEERYLDMEHCTSVGLYLGNVTLGSLRIDRRAKTEGNSRQAQAIHLKEVEILEDATIHLDGGGLYPRNVTAGAGMLIAHSLSSMDYMQGFVMDTRQAVCPGPTCYDELFEPLA